MRWSNRSKSVTVITILLITLVIEVVIFVSGTGSEIPQLGLSLFAQTEESAGDSFLQFSEIKLANSLDEVVFLAAANQANYEVPADSPRRIIIPNLEVNAIIQPVGTTSAGDMEVPVDPSIAGWFSQRAVPGEKGLSIINGHLLSGAEHEGIFSNLNQLSVGSIFQIEMGDYSKKDFIVTANYKVTNAEAQELLYKQIYISQLNLITCTGQYLKTQETFDHRQIVVARLLS